MRLLAVDIRTCRLGYAAFELPARILSFGVSTVDSKDQVQRRISELMEKIKPSTIVLCKLGSDTKRDRAFHASVVRILYRETDSSSIPVRHIREHDVRTFFREMGTHNKYEVAALLAVWFPDLAWKLPSTRKIYKPEPWTMAIFDAVAIGVVHLKSLGLMKINDTVR